LGVFSSSRSFSHLVSARRFNLSGKNEAEMSRADMIYEELVDLRTRMVRLAYNAAFDTEEPNFIAALPASLARIDAALGDKHCFVSDEPLYVDFMAMDVRTFLFSVPFLGPQIPH
jgi:hypothetical protein